MALSHYRLGKKEGTPDFFLATPCGSGRPCANYVMSLVDSLTYLTDQGMSFDYWLHSEDCHVDDSRNVLVRQFLDSQVPKMVFIDDDVGFNAENLARLLLFKDADIVGGAYPLKQPIEEYPVRILIDKPFLQARTDGLLEVEGVPTGFMRIERKVLETLAEKRKYTAYRTPNAEDDDPKGIVIFERMMVSGKRWSGDLNFCREARMYGFKIWVDPEMHFTHQGNQRWEGHLGNWIRKTQGILDPRLDQAMHSLIAGDGSKEVFADIFKYYPNKMCCGPSMMHEVYHSCLKAKGPILECGSGITSIIAGIACHRTGNTVHSLEHDLDWFRQVRNYIQLWKVKGLSLYYSPLKEYPEATPEGWTQPLIWYSDLDDLPKMFDVAIIDGPPRKYGREGVYKLMLDRIKYAKWIIDDTDDKAQRALVQKYADEVGMVPRDVGIKLRGARWYTVVELPDAGFVKS